MNTKRECRFSVEMQAENGHRSWSGSLLDPQINAYIDDMSALGYMLSDIDHTGTCWGECEDPIILT